MPHPLPKAWSLQTGTDRAPIVPLQAHISHTQGDVVLEILVSGTDYTRIDAQAMLHLDPAMRGPGQQRIRPQEPVRITARLHDAVRRVLLASLPDATDLSRAFENAGTDSPLRQQDRYYAMTVTQQVLPTVQAGYRTRWSR